jgi:histidine triad (HIT) family protein
MPSIFSRIVAGELPAYKVAEDADHLAFLDITPLVEGHTLVIPKKEVDYIFDLPADELAALNVFAQRVAKAVQAVVPCKRIGVAVIGLEVPHAHIHLIPMKSVADLNFSNPKIKVAEARMQELATAISGKVAGDNGLHKEADPKAAATKPAAAPADETIAQLQKLTAGLQFISESEAPLEAVHFPAPAGTLTDDAVRQLLGQPGSAKVGAMELTQFLRNHTADNGVLGDPALANRYKALQMFLKQELMDTQVYRLGSGPQVTAVALGRTPAGELAGFKTLLTET